MEQIREELIENGMKIMKSFDNAVHKAGGVFSIDKLKNMTAWDLLISLSQNNIKFIYEEEK